MKSAMTNCSVKKPYRTMMMDGGMSIPRVPPAAMQPVASLGEYWRFSAESRRATDSGYGKAAAVMTKQGVGKAINIPRETGGRGKPAHEKEKGDDTDIGIGHKPSRLAAKECDPYL
jgi:hypothetical protein